MVIAITEIVTPIYPIIIRDCSMGGINTGGLGLKSNAKCVRWLHSQTV